MIVVADTSPINYLLLIDKVDVLPELYQNVLIPQRVYAELLEARAPTIVREWGENLPAWCRVMTHALRHDASLSGLDAGEREAIQLALDLGIDTLLIDDVAGRRQA